MDPLPVPPLPEWLADLLPFARFRFAVEGRGMHVMTAGTGAPVLLLHGNPTWGFLWRRVAAALADAPLRLIMPDLVGLGLSDKPRDPSLHTLAAHARWLGGLVEALELPPLVFVGHDWGGPIGLRYLADNPRMARGVVLANTVAGPPRPGFRPTAFHRFARMPLVSTVAFRLFGFPQRALHRAQGDPASIRGQIARAYRWPLRRLADRTAPLALARMVPDSLQHPTVPGLERCQRFVEGFSGPAAIVWGDRDPVLGRALGRLQKMLPQAPVTRTPAGHFLQEEVPEAIADAVREVSRQAFG
ncbi:MAG TPA: alpha/beta fold hydrolase [Thermoanaerobaculia bacterium]|nr:alpha/beta fold hydrolase [Thermoanaerobaculia bacterium]